MLTSSWCASTVHSMLGLNTGCVAARWRRGGWREEMMEAEDVDGLSAAIERMRFSWCGWGWVMQVSARSMMSRDFPAKNSWASLAGASERSACSCGGRR
jgi:hypothetical protein